LLLTPGGFGCGGPVGGRGSPGPGGSDLTELVNGSIIFIRLCVLGNFK
jgi:hypothetical protein